MESNHKIWNDQQKDLRQALSRPATHSQAIGLFLKQHAMVHSAAMSKSGLWSFADEVWMGLTEEDVRKTPINGEHSIAWIFWHITRIEDVTMNMLLLGCPQLMDRGGWLDRLETPFRDTGNAMNGSKVSALSRGINIDALQAYRIDVGRQTRENVQNIKTLELLDKVDPSRLRRVLDEGAVVEDARDLLDYWGSLTYAGLLLMPPTRHNFIHLNEAWRVKHKIVKESKSK